MANRHGVFIQEEATPITVPKESSAGIQVIVGTAPVNLADDPEAVVNVPILANSATEAKAALGYSTDFAKYTLCQSMYATGSVYAVSPCVYINVLDPTKHKASVSATLTVAGLVATLAETGVLKKGLVVQVPASTDQYDEVTADAGDNPATEGWYIHDSDAGTYTLTTDDHVVSGKTYVALTPTMHTADGSEDPADLGYYVLQDDVYTLSDQHTCQNGDVFYTLVETATTPDAGDNPSTEGWYEESGSTYVATSDTYVVSGKKYYEKTTVPDPIQLVEGTDYTLSFDSDGYLAVTLIASSAYAGATTLMVSGNKINPAAVTYEDIIGGYDASTGAETGLEVIRQVYPTFNIVPAILLAPGWSQIPAVGIALAAKAASLNGSFKAMAFVDIPCGSGGATKYTDVKTVKENCGFASEFMVAYWPKVVIGDYIIYLSAIAAARTAYSDAEHDDVPSKSPSNISLAVTGVVLEDGTEVKLDQDRATTVDGFGVCTAVNLGGFKLWGNYTCAYPSSGDAKDIWISVRRMFNWQANNFILTYFDEVDDPMNTKLIENIVDSENIRCGAYVPEHWAGAYIEYLAEDNPTTDILAGRITFRQHISPYTPAETITDILSYDVDTLTAALTGGE